MADDNNNGVYPGYNKIISSTGVVLPARNRFFLGAGLSATDSPNDAATILNASGALGSLAANSILGNPTGASAVPVAMPFTGTAIGRVSLPTELDFQTLTAATVYTSVAIIPGLYNRLYWILRVSGATCTGGVITFTSLTGAYSSTEFYELGNTLGPEATVANFPHYIQGGGTGAGAGYVSGEIDIRTGFQRWAKWESYLVDAGGGPLYRRTRGFNADTTHDVTGMSISFTGGNLTGIMELWGA